MTIKANIMSIWNELNIYIEVASLTELENRLINPLSMLDEAVEYAFPSIVLGPNGPLLNSIFILTTSYLSEVRMHADKHEFDILHLKSVTDYKFEFWEQSISGDDESTIAFQMATITLMHNVSGNFGTQIYYAGLNRSEWVNLVLKAIPLRLLLVNT
jgi:hypothetical protein